MVTYVYKCTNKDCNSYDKLFEEKHSMKDDAHTYCMKCHMETLVRVIGQTQVVLKGDGWPSNDNKGVHHLNGKEKGMK